VSGELRPEFLRLAIRLQAHVDRARRLYPWSTIQRQTLAVCGEAGELAAAVEKDHGDERIDEETLDVLATATRVFFRG